MQIGNESFSSGSVSVSHRTFASSALSLLDPLIIHSNVRLILNHDSEVHPNPDNLQLKR